MMSKDPLKQFATKEEVLKSSEDIVEWDEVFNPVLNFRQAEIDNISKPPFSAGSPYPHPHTLFITADKKNVEMKRLIGHGENLSFFCMCCLLICIAYLVVCITETKDRALSFSQVRGLNGVASRCLPHQWCFVVIPTASNSQPMHC